MKQKSRHRKTIEIVFLIFLLVLIISAIPALIMGSFLSNSLLILVVRRLFLFIIGFIIGSLLYKEIELWQDKRRDDDEE